MKLLVLMPRYPSSLRIIVTLLISVPQIVWASSTPSSTTSSVAQTSIQPTHDTVQQLQSNLSSSPLDSVVLCADGKGPLLEGEERIFPCGGQCPAGFECEFVKGLIEGGICCPNLGELYRLYNEETSGEEVADQEGAEPSKKEAIQSDGNEQDEGVNAMQLLEQHYGDAIARSRPKQRSAYSSDYTASTEPSVAAIVRSRPVEIRRSQPRWQNPVEANIWRPKVHAARLALGPKRGGNVDASGEEYSCRRQRLELFCEDGRRRTQFVMRWYAKDGVCVTYPWGYCPGEPVASDRTLRTRKECEMLCTDPLDMGQDSPVVNVVRFGIGDGQNPREQSHQKREQFKQQLASAVHDKPRGEERESPVALAGAPNQEVGGAGTEVLASDSDGPEPIDLSAVEPQQQPLPPSSSSAELADFLLADQRPQPRRKRCEKVSPYRAMCPQDGMPSQFTLRWYQRGGACFAYPYGYCHGESVYAEEPIKTERECLAICVQRRENTRGLAGSRRRRLRH